MATAVRIKYETIAMSRPDHAKGMSRTLYPLTNRNAEVVKGKWKVNWIE